MRDGKVRSLSERESAQRPGPGAANFLLTPFSARGRPSCLLLRNIAHRPRLYNSRRVELNLIKKAARVRRPGRVGRNSVVPHQLEAMAAPRGRIRADFA